MRAILFANGVLAEAGAAPVVPEPGDLVIAADGGVYGCLKLGITPHILVGDLDSVRASDVAALQAAGVEVIRYPARKDYTDLELAIQEAQARGAEDILVLAALGNRWDQTLANLLLPAFFEIPVRLLDGRQEISIVRPGQPFSIHGQPGDTVSLIPISGDAHGINTQGLEYPLQGETLHFGSTRGVSNVLLAGHASVRLETGLLVCVTIHQNNGKEPKS